MAANLSVKNVPDEILERLRQRARRNHRSLQGELLMILEEAAQTPRLTPHDVLKKTRELGLRTEGDSVKIIRQLRDSR